MTTVRRATARGGGAAGIRGASYPRVMVPEQPDLPPNVVPFPGAVPDALVRQLLEQAGVQVPDGLLGAAPGGGFLASDRIPNRRPRLLDRPAEPRQFTVRVDLDGAEPPIWRRLLLAGELTLDRLHVVLQAAMGWTDSHLHHFRIGPDAQDHLVEPFLTDFAESEGEEGIHEREVRLDQVVAEPGHRLFYEYDFGDGWEHTITVESVDPVESDAPRARCVGGQRACPPEDVGGLPGYEEVLDALASSAPPDEWMSEKLAWLPPGFDPAAFELAEADDDVRRVADGGTLSGLPPADTLDEGLRDLLSRVDLEGAVLVAGWLDDADVEGIDLDDDDALAITAPWRTLLETVGEGMKLTQAGYLTPATVVELLATLPLRRAIYGKGNREENVRPVADLRQSATRLGLLRKAHGRLHVTATGKKLADDPVALVHHIARRLPLGRGDHEVHAGWLALLQAAAGMPDDPERLDARVMGGIGWRVDGDLPTYHVRWWSAEARSVLQLAGWNPGDYEDLHHDPRARALARLALRA